jgi:hypothetical protein
VQRSRLLSHSSGSTSNQWWKPKDPSPVAYYCRASRPPGAEPTTAWIGGRSKVGTNAQLATNYSCAGPTRISCLTEEAPDDIWSESLPSQDSMDLYIPSSYGQYQSTPVDHMDVGRACDSEPTIIYFKGPTIIRGSELETFLLPHSHPPGLYPRLVCSPIGPTIYRRSLKYRSPNNWYRPEGRERKQSEVGLNNLFRGNSRAYIMEDQGPVLGSMIPLHNDTHLYPMPVGRMDPSIPFRPFPANNNYRWGRGGPGGTQPSSSHPFLYSCCRPAPTIPPPPPPPPKQIIDY